MKAIHQKYIDTFNKVGSQLLNDYGYNFEALTSEDSTKIIISKSGQTNYLLTFSTDRLDYDHGVLICESNDGKLHWDRIRLPNQLSLKKGRIYRFMGVNLESEITRIILDFKKYVYSKEQLGGEPFLYCSHDAIELNVSCESEKLKKLSYKKVVRANAEKYSYLNTEEEIYQCEECKGFWKKSCDAFNREIWLRIGEVSDQKYFERNQEDFKEKQLNSFPLTFFNLSEAIECGLDLECGRFNKIDNFRGLSCVTKNLTKIKDISFNEAIGNHVKIEIYQCSKCSTYYKIREEYDSHHGVNKICIKLNESVELFFGEILEFKESEL
ncbi:MAG: hypothetical protein IM592_03245 [Bacteroidetes bacterium]|nr:hypothetical protein [Bacteroidota bacterium]